MSKTLSNQEYFELAQKIAPYVNLTRAKLPKIGKQQSFRKLTSTQKAFITRYHKGLYGGVQRTPMGKYWVDGLLSGQGDTVYKGSKANQKRVKEALGQNHKGLPGLKGPIYNDLTGKPAIKGGKKKRVEWSKPKAPYADGFYPFNNPTFIAAVKQGLGPDGWLLKNAERVLRESESQLFTILCDGKETHSMVARDLLISVLLEYLNTYGELDEWLDGVIGYTIPAPKKGAVEKYREAKRKARQDQRKKAKRKAKRKPKRKTSK